MRRVHRLIAMPFVHVCLVLLTCAAPRALRASCVVPMSLPTMADHAGQVIVGEVVSVHARWADNRTRIETEVVFKNVDYLKGRLAGANRVFKLIVPGGKVGSLKMRICCAPAFKPGDRDIVFLLPTYKTFPTVGLAQGVFRIIADADGIDRVYRNGRVPVTGIDPGGSVRSRLSSRTAPYQHLRAADRVRLAPDPASPAQAPAITRQRFLEILQPILDESRDHNFTRPAGRFAPVPFVPVEVRPSQLSAQASALTAAPRSGAAAPAPAISRGVPVSKNGRSTSEQPSRPENVPSGAGR